MEWQRASICQRARIRFCLTRWLGHPDYPGHRHTDSREAKKMARHGDGPETNERRSSLALGLCQHSDLRHTRQRLFPGKGERYRHVGQEPWLFRASTRLSEAQGPRLSSMTSSQRSTVLVLRRPACPRISHSGSRCSSSAGTTGSRTRSAQDTCNFRPCGASICDG